LRSAVRRRLLQGCTDERAGAAAGEDGHELTTVEAGQRQSSTSRL
jgi:hypothetical protein